MTAPAAPPSGTPIIRLADVEFLQLDVDYCDLVPPNRGELDESVRFKGRVVDGVRKGELVRVFVDAAGAEAIMRKTGVLRGPLPVLPAGETSLPVPLVHRRLTLRRVERPNRVTWLDIRPRAGVADAADEHVLADFHWAFAHARNDLVPLLVADGYPVGAADVVALTRELFHARRRDRLTRG